MTGYEPDTSLTVWTENMVDEKLLAGGLPMLSGDVRIFLKSFDRCRSRRPRSWTSGYVSWHSSRRAADDRLIRPLTKSDFSRAVAA
jgi:hypothetical protein